MKLLKFSILFFLTAVVTFSLKAQVNTTISPDKMMIRIAEIEIQEQFLSEYLSILKEESEASIRLEPGVMLMVFKKLKE